MGEVRRRLLWNGMFLFLLGLLTSLVEAQFTNPRMALAAHLEGVMNGMLLLAIGAVWMEVRLGPSARSIVYWALLYGTYANWLFTTLAAIMGTAALSPITGTGHGAQPCQESLVTLGFVSVGISIIVATLFLLWGFAFGQPDPFRRGAARATRLISHFTRILRLLGTFRECSCCARVRLVSSVLAYSLRLFRWKRQFCGYSAFTF